jgi:hypothetical protein
MFVGILIGFIIPVSLLLSWILILAVISSTSFRKTASKFKDDL